MNLVSQDVSGRRPESREDTLAAYLNDAFASGDATVIADALGIIARTRGLARVAQVAGVSRERLYRNLSAQSDPDLATILKVTHALGLRLVAVSSDI